MPHFIDASPKSYTDWVRLVFDQPVQVAEDDLSNVNKVWYLQDDVRFDVSNPALLLEHATRLFREFSSIFDFYSLDQIDQGLWFLSSGDQELGKHLADMDVPVAQRVECVQAMYLIYADFVANSEVEVMPTSFNMWWDCACTRFWRTHLFRLKGDEIMALMDLEDEEISPEEELRNERINQILAQIEPDEDSEAALQEQGLSFFTPDAKPHPSTQIEIEFADLEESEQQVMDAMLETLTKILHLDDTRCEQYALHGLNHLPHPKRAQTVQMFIDRYKDEWDESSLAWLEGCRDGKVM